MREPTPEDYQLELKYLQKEQARTPNDFDDFLESFQDPSPELVTTLQSLHLSPDHILDRDKLRELQTNQPELFEEISPAYLSFLKKKSGFTFPDTDQE